MFRSMSRVVVVAIVVFAFAVTSIPAYAAPQGGGKAAAKVESGWFDSMITWASQLINGIRPPKTTTTSSNVAPLSGSCVDPLGRCP
ncbi:MAG TPA: hypothetical protein VKM72_16540 [Thermoanaerobaculia bacterium]|nr:hypothetical protein [Thermoanaerobaculia bacterium]